jgi:hypothetical protein
MTTRSDRPALMKRLVPPLAMGTLLAAASGALAQTPAAPAAPDQPAPPAAASPEKAAAPAAPKRPPDTPPGRRPSDRRTRWT